MLSLPAGVLEALSSPRSQDDYANTFDGGFDDYIDPRVASDMTSSSCAVVLSYAPPDVVRQAKLEAMELKVRRKVLEPKTSLRDPHALGAPHDYSHGHSTIGIKVSARTAGVGSRDLVKSLVVPPSVTEHGDEVRGSSEVILAGQRREYQRPAGRGAGARSLQGPSTPSYRTYDPAAKQQAPEQEHSDGRGSGGRAAVAAAYIAERRMRPASGRGKGGRGPGVGKSELAVQLSEGMLTYVPAKLERPQGVESTAFVPQAQAMADARSKYDSIRTQRPSSAPPRRSLSMASSAVSSDNAGEVAGAAGAGGGAGRGWRGGGSEGQDARGGGDGNAGGRRDKWRNITVAQVEETDLFAIYKQNSQHLLAPPARPPAAPEPPQPPSSSSPVVRATIQLYGSQPEPSSRPAPPTHQADFSPRHGAQTAASATSRRQMVPEPPAEAAAAGRHQRLSSASAASGHSAGPSSTPSSPLNRARGRASTAAEAAGTAAHRTARDPPSPPAAKPSVASSGPAAGIAGRATRHGSGHGPTASGASNTWKSPRPPSPSVRPGRNAAQRPTTTTPSHAVTRGAPPGMSGPGSRPTSAASTAASGASSRAGPHLVDPTTRRLQQQHSGGAIGTAKTNRLLRGAARSATTPAWSSASDGGGGPHYGGPPQPAWAASTLMSGAAAATSDRSALQERILDGLARQYIAGPDEEAVDDGASVGEPAVVIDGAGGASAVPYRRSVGRGGRGLVQSFSMQSQGSQASVSGTLQAHSSQQHWAQQQQQQQPGRQTYQPPRPQSAPNRRVRPPSAGHWAGRPEPEALPRWSGSAAHPARGGMVYDPEMQPSPLDSYVNQLVGLD